MASALLAGIAKVDWEALYHAYGPASDVPALLDAVRQHADALLGSWRQESQAVRRTQLWLLGALPEVGHRYRDLVAAVLPVDYDRLWRALVAGEELDEQQQDRLDELEEWLAVSDQDG